MTTPGPPQIRIRPRVTDGSLEFFWQPPVSDGGDPITSYFLTDGGAFSNDLPPSGYFKQTGLINKTPYTFTIQASNSSGLGDIATFRTVQPGLLPPNPDYLSIYRASETSAKLSWHNPTTDINTPDAVRNVIVAPAADANGRTAYPGDNSVTSNAIRLFGDASNSFVSVDLDASYNFIVRAQNDPGYSGAYNGTGVFSLKDVPYTGDVLYNITQDTPTYQNTTNYSVVKASDGPLQNYNASRNDFIRLSVFSHERGLICEDDPSKGLSAYLQYRVLDKNGFTLFTTPIVGQGSTATPTYTNPVAVLIPYTDIVGASSNLTMYAYDYSDNTYASTIFTKPGGALLSAVYNERDTNAYLQITDNNASPPFLEHYVIPSGSKTPVKVLTSSSPVEVLYNRSERSCTSLLNDSTNTTFAYIVYLPNTGSYVLYDVSGEGITGVADTKPLSSGKCLVYGETGSVANLYTFTLTGTPSTQVRQVSGNDSTFITSLSEDGFDPVFNGFTSLAASFVDISGDGLRYAISHVATEPALVYSGTAQTVLSNVRSCSLTGEIYVTDADEYHFTGVGQDGSGCTVQLTYGPSATPIVPPFVYTSDKSYPFYSIHTFTDGASANPIVLLSYSTQLDMSGADISGATLVSSSDNSGVNFISVTGTAAASYTIGLNHFPPTRLSDYYITWNSTYPSNNYTIGRVDGGDIFHIYNLDTFDVSGSIGFVPDVIQAGPDCWYFIYYGGGLYISITRIATNGAKVTATFNFNNNLNLYSFSRTPTSASFVFFDTISGTYTFIIYTTETNTFVLKSYNSITGFSRSTWKPEVLTGF